MPGISRTHSLSIRVLPTMLTPMTTMNLPARQSMPGLQDREVMIPVSALLMLLLQDPVMMERNVSTKLKWSKRLNMMM